MSTTSSTSNRPFQERRVWVHAIFQGLPDWYQDNPSSAHIYYGALYPLDIVRFGSSKKREISLTARLKAAGIDALAVNVFPAANDVDWINNFLPQAGDTGVVVAPCIDTVQSEEQVVKWLKDYAAFAKSHPSTAWESGKLVALILNPANLPPASWKNVRNRLHDAGTDFYFLGNINGNLSQFNNFPRENILNYLIFDAGFVFDDSYMKFWNDIVALFKSYNYTFAGGVMPGYDRETINGGEVDAKATELYRQGWQANIDAGVQWSHVATWSDVVEHTEIRPTSDWNTTRSDITAWYAAILKGQPSPFSEPRLYITTPQQVHLNQTSPAEALVLNPTADTLTAQIQLFDGNKQAASEVISVSVPPRQAAAATIPVNPKSLPSGRFYRAYASVLKDNTVLQSVVGAPILVYEVGVQANLRNLYYSIPAYHALPGDITLSIPGNPVKGTVTSTVSPPSGITVRFVEVLQNTRQVKNMFNEPPYITEVPVKGSTNLITINDDPVGFYMARVIDEQERVGYSDPIYKK